MGFSPSRLIQDPARLRHRMVEEQLIRRGITDRRVLDAMRFVPRHLFVPESLWMSAYSDYPLPIGYGQTISQPYVVAYMSQQLHAAPGMKVLEVGTGSGYQAAVLAAMRLEVYTVERVRELYRQVKELFRVLNLRNVCTCLTDGTLGWPANAPYDRIIVTAGGPEIPKPLVDQLADPGLMIIPVGAVRREQRFVRVIKENGKITARALSKDKGSVAFVDLVGDHGWYPENEADKKKPYQTRFMEHL